MATPFENFVNDELPKRIGTNDDPLNTPAGLVPVSTGVGLGVEFQDPAVVFPGGGDALTPAGLQALLNQQGYTVQTLLKILGENSAVTANRGLFNFLFLFDNRIEQELEATDKASQYMVEMGRMEAEGYSYWKNEVGNGTEPSLPTIPNSEIRLYDDGRLQLGSLTDYLEFNGTTVSTHSPGGDASYDLTALQLFQNMQPGDEGALLTHTGTGAAWQQYPFNDKFREQLIAAGLTYDADTDSWSIDQGLME